jgi:hypothetical protein
MKTHPDSGLCEVLSTLGSVIDLDAEIGPRKKERSVTLRIFFADQKLEGPETPLSVSLSSDLVSSHFSIVLLHSACLQFRSHNLHRVSI